VDDQNEGGTTATMSFFAAALFIIGSHFAVGEIVGLIDSARPGARFDIVTLTACQLLVHLGLVFVIARIYARETSVRTILGLRPIGALTLLLAFFRR